MKKGYLILALAFVFFLLFSEKVKAACLGQIKCTRILEVGCDDTFQVSSHLCSSQATQLACTNFYPCLNECSVGACTWDSSGDVCAPVCRYACNDNETSQGQGACASPLVTCILTTCIGGDTGTTCTNSRAHAEIPITCGNSGFYGRSYLSGSTSPIAETYSCAPYGNLIAGTACYGYYDNKWNGYLNIPESGNYEFRVTFQRGASVQIDVNGDGVFADDATCTRNVGNRMYGDSWYFLNGSSLGSRYRPGAFGGSYNSCWADYETRTPCDAGRHWQNADNVSYVTAVWNAVTNRTDILTSLLPSGSYKQGTTECPISARNYSSSDEDSDWPARGSGYSFFTRTLAAGSVKMEMFLTARYGDADPYNSNMSLSYRKVGDATWVDLADAGTYPGGICPVTSCEVEIADADAWWQVKDGDVTTNGSISSTVPDATGTYFNEAGPGGYPGVPMYRGSINLTASNVSETGWMANSAYSSAKMYNSSFFINSIPADVVINTVPSSSVDGSFFESGGTESYGYYWYVYDATSTGIDLSIDSAADLGSRKVILIVKGASLNINGSINLTDGSGFFLAVSSLNINVASTVGGSGSADLEGVYVADLLFTTGTGGAATDSQLWLRGTVAAYGGITLQRDLGGESNAASPAEYFEYAPDQELLFPTKLSARPSAWREVAP